VRTIAQEGATLDEDDVGDPLEAERMLIESNRRRA